MLEFRRRMAWLLWRDDLRQREAAKACGINQCTFSDMMRGVRKPTAGALARISKQFGVSESWLIGEGEVEDGYTTQI